MKLLNVDTIESAKAKIEPFIRKYLCNIEEVSLLDSLDCVVAEDIYSSIDVPHFRRSTVDGYAVVSSNTQGASETIPVFLKVVDEVEIGSVAMRSIESGECAYVPTGGMIPDGADAMVMVEYTEMFSEDEVAIYESVPYNAHVVQVGEDVRKEELVLAKGTKILPQHIGVLASIGKQSVSVYRGLDVTIISTGDELTLLDEPLKMGKIFDINTYTLVALCKKYGIHVVNTFVLKDEENLLKDTVYKSMRNSDIVLVSGGSSQGKKDVSAKVLDELSSSGVLTHGIAIKPGKPTITAFDEESKTLLVGLPGHPVAAMMLFEILVMGTIHEVIGKTFNRSVKASMKSNVMSAPGRTTLQLVSLEESECGWLAEPVFGKSGLITTLTKASGYVVIDVNKEGLKRDEEVMVHLF